MNECTPEQQREQKKKKYSIIEEEYSTMLITLNDLDFNQEQADSIILRRHPKKIVKTLADLDNKWRGSRYTDPSGQTHQWNHASIAKIAALRYGYIRLKALCEYTPALIGMGFSMAEIEYLANIDYPKAIRDINEPLEQLYTLSRILNIQLGFSFAKVITIFRQENKIETLKLIIENAQNLLVHGITPMEMESLVSESGNLQLLLSAGMNIKILYDFGYNAAAVLCCINTTGIKKLESAIAISITLKALNFSIASIQQHILSNGINGLFSAHERLNSLTTHLPGWKKIPDIMTATNCFLAQEILLIYVIKLKELQHQEESILHVAIMGGLEALDRLLIYTIELQKKGFGLAEIRQLLHHADGIFNLYAILICSEFLFARGLDKDTILYAAEYKGVAGLDELIYYVTFLQYMVLYPEQTPPISTARTPAEEPSTVDSLTICPDDMSFIELESGEPFNISPIRSPDNRYNFWIIDENEITETSNSMPTNTLTT